MFLPTNKKELAALNWNQCDVILVTGDAYIDHPMMGIAVIGKVLMQAGFRVGVIPQPDVTSGEDIVRLGEPRLFWGVSGGALDSMVANWTALKKRRKHDDYTPGGLNNKRPDRAVIAYANLIRRYFKPTAHIVLGGIEASLRRIAHYDYWNDTIRRSVLFDAKANYLIYGMGETPVLQLADALKANKSVSLIRGLCYIAKEENLHYLRLPDYDTVKSDPRIFTDMFLQFYENQDARTAKGLVQKQDTRFLIHNPPALPLSQSRLDAIYALDFERDSHPAHRKSGKVRALDTIQFSVASHRGCYGGCHFCSIAMHEGREVQWRSEDSVVMEVQKLITHKNFKGIVHDVGGPTANMYGFECEKKKKQGACQKKQCLYPAVCPELKVSHEKQIALLRKLRKLSGIRKIFIGSGIRYDLILADSNRGHAYLRELTAHHVSGQLKVAPEHADPQVLKLMRKPGIDILLRFKSLFDAYSKTAGKAQFLTYYFIAAYPGCRENEMQSLRQFVIHELKLLPEQVQIYTPLPSTPGSLMYYTGRNPFNHQKLYVEKSLKGKLKQKQMMQ